MGREREKWKKMTSGGGWGRRGGGVRKWMEKDGLYCELEGERGKEMGIEMNK